MSNVKVTQENFANAVQKLLEKYGDEAYDISQAAAKKSARETTSELKQVSPVGNNGSYARGWSHKAQKNGVTQYSETVYNRQYQLTHLLEKPHETGGGGHYPKNKDHTGIIARVEEQNVNRFVEAVISKL